MGFYNLYLNGPRGDFQLINRSTQPTKELYIGKTMVVQGYETALTLTFHIATGTLEEMKAKS